MCKVFKSSFIKTVYEKFFGVWNDYIKIEKNLELPRAIKSVQNWMKKNPFFACYQ